MKNQQGFTVIELIAVVIILFAAGTLFFFQKQDIDVYHQDNQRKLSVNAIHHHLEEIYYPEHKAYPEEISQVTLKGLSSGLLEDPAGLAINESGSTLRYEPVGCDAGKCSSYTLRADLEKEADFVKKSRRN